MWTYILQNVILSILIVILVQYLWDHFKTTNHSRKTRDIVDFQTKKYREMFNDIQESSSNQTTDDFISPEDKTKMINELLSFVNLE